MNELELQLREIVETVWGTTFGLFADCEETPSSLGDQFYGARLELDSEVVSEVYLACSTPMARRAAEGMFGMNADDISAAEMEEVVGELINIVAGNLRPLVGSPTMGLPILDGSTPPEDGSTLGFVASGMPFNVTLMGGGSK